MFFLIPIAALVLPALILAGLATQKPRSAVAFLCDWFLCLTGIVIPIAVFLLSGLMIPDGVGDCNNGWIDCFPTGKLALTPFVFWGAWALYQFQIRETPRPVRKKVVLGLFVGAVVSSVSCVLGFISLRNGLAFMMVIPFYTAVWYTLSAIVAAHDSGLKFSDYAKALGAFLPFWGLSLYWSWNIYQNLPTERPGCFVVTAASRGHRRIVGPQFPTTRRGCSRLANQQLLVFWQFETAWQNISPLTHTIFRRGYNIVGPIIARRITSPWVADIFYLALKPAECFARFAISVRIVRRPSHSFQMLKSYE